MSSSSLQGDANRSDTDEDKTSANFDDDFEKLKDLRATGRVLPLRRGKENLRATTLLPQSSFHRHLEGEWKNPFYLAINLIAPLTEQCYRKAAFGES